MKTIIIAFLKQLGKDTLLAILDFIIERLQQKYDIKKTLKDE